jgi:hypothetical protein
MYDRNIEMQIIAQTTQPALWVEVIPSYLTAFGTIAVAILAIWGESVRIWLSPKLRLSPKGSFRPSPLNANIYYHLEVQNPSKSTPAKGCRVVLERLEKRILNDHDFREKYIPVEHSFVWAPNENPPKLITIDPNSVATIDFGHVQYTNTGYLFRATFHWTAGEVVNNATIHPGEACRFYAVARGENLRPSSQLIVEVSLLSGWDGQSARIGEFLHITDITKEPS